jgi:hypothetical protein
MIVNANKMYHRICNKIARLSLEKHVKDGDVIVVRISPSLEGFQHDIANEVRRIYSPPKYHSLVYVAGEANIYIGKIISEGSKKIIIKKKVV